MDAQDVLRLKLDNNDFDEGMEIKDYFKELLMRLWREKEGFSGKRPFGNSGWEYDLYKPLIAAKIIKGEIDKDGYIDGCDKSQGNAVIEALINDMFK